MYHERSRFKPDAIADAPPGGGDVRREREGGPGRAQLEYDFSAIRLYEGNLLFNIRSGGFYRVSETGAFIVRALANRASVSDVVTAMQAAFNIDRSVATRDFEFFARDLVALGFLPATLELEGRGS